ncbi:ATPase SWSAP1 [Bagarius yarrelli]|uniref:ATPase SWSAP1 n=1 Tax=Bagarius yarrelli TaxID=175774 RepID=A0A556TVW8_BAGYA|nr:ATPase SWSAP1 [Bagarius yarrelli]
MVDILSVVLHRYGSQLHTSGDIKVSPQTENSTLLVGDKTITRSLLLLTALTAASELEYKVLFFTQSQIQSLPENVQDLSASLKPDSLKKIRFVYPKTLEELLEDVASLHELVPETVQLPSLLIIDGFERYVRVHGRTQQDSRSATAYIVALLHDTAVFLGTRSQKIQQPPCRVIVSYQPEWEGRQGDTFALDTNLFVLERYLQVRCNIHKVTDSGEAQNEWMMYLSGPGFQVDDHGTGEKCLGLQWRVVMHPNGALEFRPETAPKEQTSGGQHSDCGNEA